MKKYIKRNQVLISALAIMIAVAGYLSFQDKQRDEKQSAVAVSKEGTYTYDLSLEDLSGNEIEALEDDGEAYAANFLESDMSLFSEEGVMTSSDNMDQLSGGEYQEVALGDSSVLEEDTAENGSDDSVMIPGEAVFTSGNMITSLSGAKLLKEQTRAKNKETLLEIINNTNISEEAKVEAIAQMVESTRIADGETNAEILLEAKGFQDAVVSVSGDFVDVCIVAESLTDAQRAQIEDIVQRKTDIAPENIIITTVW